MKNVWFLVITPLDKRRTTIFFKSEYKAKQIQALLERCGFTSTVKLLDLANPELDLEEHKDGL